jgi:hypothetical protein
VGGTLQATEDIEITAHYDPLKKETSEEEHGCEKCQRLLFTKLVKMPKRRIVGELGTNYKKADQDIVTLESRQTVMICYSGCCN